MSMTQFNKADVARFMGVSVNTVTQWVGKGLPYIQKGGAGKSWVFDMPEVVAWREEQIALAAVGDTASLDIDEARRRKLAAEAALAEIEVSKKRGEVVEIEAVADAVGDDYANVRAKLLSLPTKAAPQLAIIEDSAEAQGVLEKLVHEALEELTADGIYESAVSGAPDPEERESKAAT